MTQEILDSLWTKSLFIKSSEKELLTTIATEEDLERLCRSIYQIQQLEKTKFFYTNPDFISKLESILLHKRFENKHSQIMVDYFNSIINVIHDYRQFSIKEKEKIVQFWIREEAEYRKLPYRKLGKYHSMEIQDILLWDNYCMPFLLNDTHETPECGPIFFLNSINLLISEYPYLFNYKPDVFYRCMSMCMQADRESTFIQQKRIQKTKTLLSKLESI